MNAMQSKRYSSKLVFLERNDKNIASKVWVAYLLVVKWCFCLSAAILLFQSSYVCLWVAPHLFDQWCTVKLCMFMSGTSPFLPMVYKVWYQSVRRKRSRHWTWADCAHTCEDGKDVWVVMHLDHTLWAGFTHTLPPWAVSSATLA